MMLVLVLLWPEFFPPVVHIVSSPLPPPPPHPLLPLSAVVCCRFAGKQNIGNQIGGKGSHDDVWLLDCRYRTAVVHQKESWTAVTAKLREVFAKVCHTTLQCCVLSAVIQCYVMQWSFLRPCRMQWLRYTKLGILCIRWQVTSQRGYALEGPTTCAPKTLIVINSCARKPRQWRRFELFQCTLNPGEREGWGRIRARGRGSRSLRR